MNTNTIMKSITKQDWIECGDGNKDIEHADIEAAIGQKIPSKVEHFEDMCAFVYLVLTGNKMPVCFFRGRGFRSQWHGKTVSEVWPEKPIDDAAAKTETK